MKILHLTLTRKWFDMIAAGIKLEEYRQIKKYWAKRLCAMYRIDDNRPFDRNYRHYDIIRFKNGYAKDAPTMDVRLNYITTGTGEQDWGAEPGEEYFVLGLGEILSIQNYTLPDLLVIGKTVTL